MVAVKKKHPCLPVYKRYFRYFTMDLCERFIEEVQKRPALFGKTDNHYCNRVYLKSNGVRLEENSVKAIIFP